LITNSGDTLRGSIIAKRRKGSIQSIQFNNEKTFGLLDVKRFSINGSEYLSQIVSIDKSPKIEIKVIDTVFLEVLSKGQVSLLSYIDEYDKNHFFIARSSEVEELILKIKALDDGVHFITTPLYKDQLKGYFPKSSDLYPEIDKTPYKRKPMQNIFIKCYENEFGKGTLSLIAAKEKTTLDLGLTAGLAFSKISYRGHYTDGSAPIATKFNFNESVTFSGGISFDLRFSRISNTFSLYNEFQYKQLKSTGEYEALGLIDGTVGNVKSTGNINEKFLKYNLLMRFRVNGKENTPFVNAGFANSFVLSDGDFISANGAQYSRYLSRTPKKFEPGLILGIGYTTQVFRFELRYERSPGISGESSITSKTNSFYTMISYSLFRSKN